MAACFRSVEGCSAEEASEQANLGKFGLPGGIVVLEAPEHFAVKCIRKRVDERLDSPPHLKACHNNAITNHCDQQNGKHDQEYPFNPAHERASGTAIDCSTAMPLDGKKLR